VDHHDNWHKTAEIIQSLGPLGNSSGPGHWNDADFLMTGGAGCDNFIPGNHCPVMFYSSLYLTHNTSQQSQINKIHRE